MDEIAEKLDEIVVLLANIESRLITIEYNTESCPETRVVVNGSEMAEDELRGLGYALRRRPRRR